MIPAFNEAMNLRPLYKEIQEIMEPEKIDYEVIFVNDGSRDGTQNEIENLYAGDKKHVRGIQLRNNFGKAAALHAGFQAARGEIILQMDADGQDDPTEIPKFIKKLDEGFDMVVGWKHKRRDSFVKNNSSKIFNAATNVISRVKLHDHNCGFKAYQSEVAQGLNLYGELHRYIAVIASSQGYTVSELPVNHRLRKFGRSKYGPMRFVNGLLDLLTVLFITRFRTRPLHLFGYLGLSSLTVGFVIGVYLTGVKLLGNQSIGERPLLLLAVMLMIMGVQISVTGLVGEQIISFGRKENYIIKKTI